MSIAIQIATLVATLIGFSGLIFTFWSFRRTMHSHVMMTYAERFAKLMDELPRELFIDSQTKKEEPPATQDVKLTFLKYFNLTLEEYYLQKKGYFPKDLWQVWEADIKKLLAHPLMKREWTDLRDSFRDDPEFFDFVENAQKPDEQPSAQNASRD